MVFHSPFSISHSINHLINQPINHPIAQALKRSSAQALKRSIKCSIHQPFMHTRVHEHSFTTDKDVHDYRCKYAW
jgi:hypothetical protein